MSGVKPLLRCLGGGLFGWSWLCFLFLFVGFVLILSCLVFALFCSFCFVFCIVCRISSGGTTAILLYHRSLS